MAINNYTEINVALVHLGKNANEYELDQSVPPHKIVKWSSENKDAQPTDDELNAAWTDWKAKEQYKQEKMIKEIEESKQRQKVAEQKREAWKNMNLMERMAAEPLTQDQILRNRQRYGVGQ